MLELHRCSREVASDLPGSTHKSATMPKPYSPLMDIPSHPQSLPARASISAFGCEFMLLVKGFGARIWTKMNEWEKTQPKVIAILLLATVTMVTKVDYLRRKGEFIGECTRGLSKKPPFPQQISRTADVNADFPASLIGAPTGISIHLKLLAGRYLQLDRSHRLQAIKMRCNPHNQHNPGSNPGRRKAPKVARLTLFNSQTNLKRKEKTV